jgi:hypothetical protein
MNSLSWFIYFVDLIPTVAGLFGFVSLLSVFGIIITFFSHCIRTDRSAHSHSYPIPLNFPDTKWEERASVVRKQSKFFLKLFITLAFVFSILWAVIPSKNTIILIGASEFGERIINSESVTGIVDPSMNLLKVWIEQQTNAINQQKRN